MEESDAPAIKVAPAIFQREISKRSDIRVIVVDDQIFSTRIESQAHADTRVDWRRGARTDLVHETITLPDDVSLACTEITRSLGLRFAAIDLVEDKSGNFWFLEANPNGQWAWIEQRTGAPISSTIADSLSK